MGCGRSREAEVVFAPDTKNRSSIAVATDHLRTGQSRCCSCRCGRRKAQPTTPRHSVFGDDEDGAPEADWWEGGIEGGSAVNIEYPVDDANSDDDESEDEGAGQFPDASTQDHVLEDAVAVQDRPQPKISRRVKDLERAAAQVPDGPQDGLRDLGALEILPIQINADGEAGRAVSDDAVPAHLGQREHCGEWIEERTQKRFVVDPPSGLSAAKFGTEIPKQASRRPRPPALPRAPWNEESDEDASQTPPHQASKANRPVRSADSVGIETTESVSQRAPEFLSSVGESGFRGRGEGTTAKQTKKRKDKKTKAPDNPPDLSLASIAGAFAFAIGDDLEQGGTAEAQRKDISQAVDKGLQQPAKSRSKKHSRDEKAARKRPKHVRQQAQYENEQHSSRQHVDDDRHESRSQSDVRTYEIMF